MKSKGNPQIEDGFVRVANELLEEIMKFPFTKRELKLILYIVRYSYGFHQTFIIDGAKKQKKIAEKIGVKQGDISITIRLLEKKNVIKIEDGKLTLNKHYKEWKNIVNYYIQKNIVKHNKKYSKTLYKNIVKHYIEQPKNTDEKLAIKDPKDILLKKGLNIKNKQVKKQPVPLKKDSKKNEVYELFTFFYSQLNERNKKMGLPEANIKHIKFPPQAKSAKVLLSWFPLSYWKSFLKSMFQVKGFYSEHCTTLRYLEEYYETAIKPEVKKALRR